MTTLMRDGVHGDNAVKQPVEYVVGRDGNRAANELMPASSGSAPLTPIGKKLVTQIGRKLNSVHDVGGACAAAKRSRQNMTPAGSDMTEPHARRLIIRVI